MNKINKNIKATTGTAISAKSWLTEAAVRMLMNNLDPEIAEHPQDLIVYGGIGKAARNWECYDKIISSLKKLEFDQTLLIQSGKPVGIFQTHVNSPKVLIANSNLVPRWANWEKFNELDKKGLMMFGQMTAGSWIYIGSQGIIQGTYETFVAMAKKHYNGNLKGKWILTAGLGGMGGAQPLAGVLAGACVLAVECDESKIDFRIRTKYLDHKARNLEEAVSIIKKGCNNRKVLSVGLLGNIAEIMPKIIESNIIPDAVTDQTSAHDPLNGYLPIGYTLKQAKEERKKNPKNVIYLAKESMAVHVNSMLKFHKIGIPTFDYGNNIRQMAYETGKCRDAFNINGFVPEYIRPLFCEGIGPFRWVALSGDPEDIYKTDHKMKQLFPKRKSLHNWLNMAKEKISFQGLPARICWIGVEERSIAGVAFNKMVRMGELKAPIVIGRDHLDSGSVASPNRETESMMDGSDIVSDWPILNALLNTASGATWVSLHHGGGVGMGFSQHSGVVIVADGSKGADYRLKLVLTNDPATGVMRHADAGYGIARRCAIKNNILLPFLK